MNKIKKGDEVLVRAGRSKGGRGVVLKVVTEYGGNKPEKVVVEGCNMVTHFERPDPQSNKPGGLIKREAPIHVSNVSLIDADGRPSRSRRSAGGDEAGRNAGSAEEASS